MGTHETDADTPLDPVQVIREAEAIRAGGDPSDAPPSPSEGSAEGAGAPGSPDSPPPLDLESIPPGVWANLAVVLVDHAFIRLAGFGEAGRLEEPLRTEAAKAWEAAIREYAPSVQKAGPLGALAAIYGAHLSALMLPSLLAAMGWATQQAGSVPAQSDATGPAKQPS